MAEFKEVMRQAKRMCDANGDTCLGCPLTSREGCVFIKTPYNLTEEEAAKREKIVMDWAAAHPEPRYPTWVEWWKNTFPDAEQPLPPCKGYFMSRGECKTTCEKCKNQPIPADIAEKLGIKPMGGDNDA